MKKYLILTLFLLMLSPALTAFGYTEDKPNQTVYTPTGDEINGDITANTGDTAYYDIVQLNVPELGDGMPDLTGNQLFIKIMAISEYTSPARKYVTAAMGMYFTKDTTITVGEGVLATDFIIPKDSATPSMAIDGGAHFNESYGGPLVFLLNQEWAIHQTFLEAIGLTVTNGADTFEAGFDNSTGTVDLEWRKSDGFITRFYLDDVIFLGMNITGGTLELNLDRVENTPFSVSVGDELQLDVDLIDVEVSGSGPIYDEINQTELTSIINTYESYEGITAYKYIVEDVEGLYYACSYYYYDEVTEGLKKSTDTIVFNAFLGCYQADQPPLWGDYNPNVEYIGGFYAPFISPDWGLYEAQMKLYGTIIDVYMEDILDLMSINPEQETYHAIGGSADFVSKRSYKYFKMNYGVDYEQNNSYTTSIVLTFLQPNVYNYGTRTTINAEAYLAYHESGEFAAFRVAAEYSHTENNDVSVSETGTITINVDIKFRNPDYDPPDVLGGNFIPGFTWAIVIPTLIGVAAYSIIIRRRK